MKELSPQPYNSERSSDDTDLGLTKPEANKATTPERLASQRSDSNLDMLSPSLERRKAELEKRLLQILLPARSPLRMTVWRIAANLAKAEIGKSKDSSKEEKPSSRQLEITTRIRTERIVEAILSQILKELALPLLKRSISEEYRQQIEEYQALLESEQPEEGDPYIE